MVRAWGLFVAVGVLTLLSGCVERRFRVESTPPGAAVFVNDVPYGSAPVDIPFTYYGTYNITLVKDGFQSLHVKQKISPPWYQYPPIDFFSESVWPFQLTDLRPFHYEMQPLPQPNLDEIKRDAEELRLRGKGLPPPKYPQTPRDKDKPITPGPMSRPLQPKDGDEPPPLPPAM